MVVGWLSTQQVKQAGSRFNRVGHTAIKPYYSRPPQCPLLICLSFLSNVRYSFGDMWKVLAAGSTLLIRCDARFKAWGNKWVGHTSAFER